MHPICQVSRYCFGKHDFFLYKNYYTKIMIHKCFHYKVLLTKEMMYTLIHGDNGRFTAYFNTYKF